MFQPRIAQLVASSLINKRELKRNRKNECLTHQTTQFYELQSAHIVIELNFH